MVAVRWNSNMRRMLGELRKPAWRKLVKPILEMVSEVISSKAGSISQTCACACNSKQIYSSDINCS